MSQERKQKLVYLHCLVDRINKISIDEDLVVPINTRDVRSGTGSVTRAHSLRNPIDRDPLRSRFQTSDDATQSLNFVLRQDHI